jgi:L-rhamnose mutarotase
MWGLKQKQENEQTKNRFQSEQWNFIPYIRVVHRNNIYRFSCELIYFHVLFIDTERSAKKLVFGLDFRRFKVSASLQQHLNHNRVCNYSIFLCSTASKTLLNFIKTKSDKRAFFRKKKNQTEHENTWEKTSSKLLYASSMQNKTRENLQHIHSVLNKKNLILKHMLSSSSWLS